MGDPILVAGDEAIAMEAISFSEEQVLATSIPSSYVYLSIARSSFLVRNILARQGLLY